MKDTINIIHSGITFECNQCKRAFSEKGRLRTHFCFVHYMIQFLTCCNKCPFFLLNLIIHEKVKGRVGLVSCRRGSLALTKVEQLIVLKENRRKVEEFNETSDYKLKAVDVNAFQKVIVHISEGNIQIENIDIDSDLYEDTDI